MRFNVKNVYNIDSTLDFIHAFIPSLNLDFFLYFEHPLGANYLNYLSPRKVKKQKKQILYVAIT